MNYLKGLTTEEVLKRQSEGKVNYEVKVKSKSIKKIIFTNAVTIFNILNLSLGILVLTTHSYKNLLFLGIIVLNTLIGIYEEIKTKKELSKLRIIASNKATVIRDGKEFSITQQEIVLDDLICYKAGSQVLVDSLIKDGEVLVDESFITGESEAIYKKIGDTLLSGSFIINGEAKACCIHFGKDNYSAQIISQISDIDNNNSIVIKGLKKFIKFISFIIIPLGLILFYRQYNIDHDYNSSIISTVAALISMIPDGLILLSSTVFMIAALKLSRRNILVQDLNCIDSLANIDTFCFDKTGTITNDEMEVKKIISLNKDLDVLDIVSAYANLSHDDNATIRAIKNYNQPKKKYEVLSYENFSSYTKTSSITFKDLGTFVLGAKEYISKDFDISAYERDYRVLLFAHTKSSLDKLEVIGIILISDTIKENAQAVISNLIKKDVDVKLISGDSSLYLETIAKRLDFKYVKGIDMSTLDNPNYDEIAANYNIFARSTPKQKLELMRALRKNHKVAYMGDGVNDTLALKEADASISFINAKESAKNVSKIILLNDDFNSINVLIDTGRKSVNNLTRSATLFINKTIYATLLALLFIFVHAEYPFSPIQLTLNNFVLIGFPSFVLSLLPNNEKVTKNFFKDVLKNSIPIALIIFLNIVTVLIMSNFIDLSNDTSTLCFYLVTFNGFMLLYKICKPFNAFTITLMVILLLIYLSAIIWFKDLFNLTYLIGHLYIFLGIMCLINICLFKIINQTFDKILNTKKLNL